MRKLKESLPVRCIEWYQRHISPRIPGNQGACIYYPYEASCSEYAKQQFASKSFVVALALSLVRLMSCNPVNGYLRAWKRSRTRTG